MAAQWFAKVCGEVLGPMSPAQLRELARRGAIQPDTSVRKGTDGNWVLAERVKGLFTAPEMRVASAPPSAPEWVGPVPAPYPPDATRIVPHETNPKPRNDQTAIVLLAVGTVFLLLILGGLVGAISSHSSNSNSPTYGTGDRYQYSQPITVQDEHGNTHVLPAGDYSRGELERFSRDTVDSDSDY